jgi:hypothetical protein
MTFSRAAAVENDAGFSRRGPTACSREQATSGAKAPLMLHAFGTAKAVPFPVVLMASAVTYSSSLVGPPEGCHP